MGIDARIIVRKVPKAIVTVDWLKERSWLLCQGIGAQNFFISDGVPPAEYEAATKAWLAAFEAHPLHSSYSLAREREGVFSARESSNAIAEAIRADIGNHEVKEMRLAIEPTGTHYRHEGDPEPGSYYADDGPVEFNAAPGECLLQVNLCGRYYGPDYERGDILVYCAIAEWLEQNIQGCEVWYGGDSSGVEIRRFDARHRAELRKHLYSQEGRDYYNRGMRDTFEPKACSICPGGIYRGSQFGFGQNGQYGSFSCAGCGKQMETEDGGKTWSELKEPA